MAKFDLLIQHTLKWEGDHGADPQDNALKLGHSGVLGKTINPKTKKPYDRKFPNNYVHTSSGVIWNTYVEYCKEKKKTPNANEFLLMDKKLWQDIYKTLFWDKILGDKINSQGIAENLMEARWIGGGAYLIRDTIRYLNKEYNANLPVTGTVTQNLVNSLNKNINDRTKYLAIIKYLYDQRLKYYQSLSDWKRYGAGWTNRLNELYNRSIKYPHIFLNLAWFFKLFGVAMFFF